MNACFLRQIAWQNVRFVRKTHPLRGSILKPIKRSYIPLKICATNFSPPFKRSACFYTTMTGHFERFQNLNFETSFFEKLKLFLKNWRIFFSSEYSEWKRIISMQNCAVKSQKQSSRGVLKKRYSENMRQVYRRKPPRKVMPKSNFHLELYWNSTSAQVVFC